MMYHYTESGKYKLENTETGAIVYMTLAQILDEVNRDHSEDWTDYTAEDNLHEALEHWTEYRFINEAQ